MNTEAEASTGIKSPGRRAMKQMETLRLAGESRFMAASLVGQIRSKRREVRRKLGWPSGRQWTKARKAARRGLVGVT